MCDYECDTCKSVDELELEEQERTESDRIGVVPIIVSWDKKLCEKLLSSYPFHLG